jgi:hypothetical protein
MAAETGLPKRREHLQQATSVDSWVLLVRFFYSTDKGADEFITGA